MKKLNLVFVLCLLFGFVSCEDYGSEEDNGNSPVIRAGEALKIANTDLSDLSLTRATRICEALERHHDDILRNVFNESFTFTRRKKVYGDSTIRNLTDLSVYIEVPNDYTSTPTFASRNSSTRDFITAIPTDNNLYLKTICDYTLNNVGSIPKVQEQVGARYQVYHFLADNRVDIGIYTKHSDGSYYLYRSYQYRVDIDSSSRYYGMVREQSEIFIRDYRGSDYSLIYQSFKN